MCMSAAPSKMSDTLLYVGEASRNKKTVHVLAYQNKAINKTSAPNAMILPFPACTPMDERNVIDTTNFKSFLTDIAEATKYQGKLLGSRGFSRRYESLGDDALVFDVGSYTVVLAENVFDIPKALTKVPEDKRPNLSTRFLEGFDKLYTDQPVAVCCWNSKVEAEPLLWWYEPEDVNTLFVPTMDAHDGAPPDLKVNVYADHTISAGSAIKSMGAPIRYRDKIPKDVMNLLPTNVQGTKWNTLMKNGDSFIKTDEVRTKKYGAVITRGSQDYEMFGWY